MRRDDPAGLILVVEDNRNLSEMVGEYLESKGFGVDYAGDGMDGYRLAADNSYDVIVLDLMLPRLDGLEVCRRLRNEAKKSTPVLMLTARDTLNDKVVGLEAGADDYLVKPFAIQELEARVRALIRRDRRQVSAEVLKVADLVLDTASLRVTRAGQEIALSPIGLRLLGILMRESPRVVTRRDIEREIWGDGLPDSDTLRSHLYNLRKAIDRPFDRPLLHTVQTAGYRIADLDAPARGLTRRAETMPNQRTGLRRKIWVAFILQAAAISFAAVLGVYGASAVLKHVLVKRALQEEAAHYWADHRTGTNARLPETHHLDGYLLEPGGDRSALPGPIRALPEGFHSLPRSQGGLLVLVDADDRGRTLYLTFRQQRLDDLAFWFGVVPLAIVLAVIYVIAWSTYRASRRAVSPVIWLASQVKRWDPKNPESSVLKPENLPLDVEGETLVLASSLHDYASRIGEFVDRERDFTRDASHELRTPLAVIRVAGDMMSGDEHLSSMSKRALKRIQGAGRDMEALIEAFLILAREGDTGLPDDDFAVGDILEEEIGKARVMFASKPVKIELVKNTDFHLQAPARVLSVLVGNLLRNASHYTDKGSVTVTLDHGRITIVDTGIGMNAESLSHAFEPYYTGHGKEGQGLGLSIVRRLSSRYGWRVELDSAPGRGTTATLTFPGIATG